MSASVARSAAKPAMDCSSVVRASMISWILPCMQQKAPTGADGKKFVRRGNNIGATARTHRKYPGQRKSANGLPQRSSVRRRNGPSARFGRQPVAGLDVTFADHRHQAIDNIISQSFAPDLAGHLLFGVMSVCICCIGRALPVNSKEWQYAETTRRQVQIIPSNARQYWALAKFALHHSEAGKCDCKRAIIISSDVS